MTTQNPSQPSDLFFEPIVEGYLSNLRFVRRDWLAEEIAHRLNMDSSRFVLLTAEPGFGKSAFMAQLAAAHPDWPRYFIRRDQRTPLGDVDAKSFLLRIGYQLAALHPDLFTQERVRLSVEQRIGDVAAKGEVVGAEVKRILASPFYQKAVEIRQYVERNAGRIVGLKLDELVIETRQLDPSDLLSMALLDPARALRERDPAAQIVVLVDALDEIRYHEVKDNILKWLTNCPELPPNVHFVLSSRPPDDALKVFCEKQELSIRRIAVTPEDPQVQSDVQIYARRLATRPDVATELVELNIAIEPFVAQAVEKANGNLGYLGAVERAIDAAFTRPNGVDRASLDALLKLSQLPNELGALYGFFLHQIKASVARERIEFTDPQTGETYDKAVWPAVYHRVLGVLAVALAPLRLDHIMALGGIKVGHEHTIEAMNSLAQFVDTEQGSYRLYHATLPEFLTAPSTREQVEMTDLWIDASDWNKQIANHYWNTYHEDWQQCDLYGLRNLVSHQIAGLSFLQNPADKQMQTKTIYNVVLDAAFRKAQHTKSGDGNISLNDLRHALDLALACDDIVPALKCVAAYRESIRGDQLVQPFFEAIDAQAFDLAQKHLSVYKGFLEWYAVAHLYLAWEASRAGDVTTASELVQAARKLPVELTTELCRALRVQVAITLSQSATAVVPAMAYLEQWQTSEDRQYLEKLTNVAIPSPSALSHLRDELRSPEKAHWYEGDTAKKVIDILLQLVTTDEGRTDIDEFIRETRQWKYPHYRDVRLRVLGIACAAAPDPIWMRKQLRNVLVAVLDQEGATFMFALPAMLSAEAQVHNLAAPELAAYLESGLNTNDRFGTNLWVMLANARAEFRQGKHEQAFQTMQRISSQLFYSHINAGASVLTLLATSDQYLERGCVDLSSGLIRDAEGLVSWISDDDLLDQRRALVAEYYKWTTEQSLPEIEHISAALNAFQDNDTRMAYINHLAARWAGAQEGPNLPGLKALIVPSLNDGTTLDATLARFIGLNLRHLTDDDLNELIQLVGKSLPVD